MATDASSITEAGDTLIEPTSFWSFRLGDLAPVLAVLLGVLVWRRDQKNASDEQQKMHTENGTNLNTLLKFQQDQVKVNSKRDEQVSELKAQTRELTQISKGQDRRLQLLENR